MDRHWDIAVLGGGIIGRAVAFELGRRRAGRIGIIDHGALGGEASSAAAAFLPVASTVAPRGLLFELGRASLSSYPAFLSALEEAGGGAPRLVRSGCLLVARDAQRAATLRRRVAHRRGQGMAAEMLDRQALRTQAPGLADTFEAGALFPDEARVDAPALMPALERACRNLGVIWMRGRAVLHVDDSKHSVAVRVGSEMVRAATLVLAAGWWTAHLAEPLGIRLLARPARGEMIELAGRHGLGRAAIEDGILLLPQGDDRLLVGGLVEFSAEAAPTAQGREALIERARTLWPAARDAGVAAHWAGVRCCSDARHPIVDRVPGWQGVVIATGHHRSGFLLAPITAQIVSARVFGEQISADERAVCWPVQQ